MTTKLSWGGRIGVALMGFTPALENPVRQFNRYRYGNGNPYRFKDPDGRVAIVSRAKDGTANVQIPAKFTGSGATPQNIAAFKDHVAAMSGTYEVNGSQTQVKFEVTDIGKGTPRKARNEIVLVNGQTSHPEGRSFAELGGKRSEIDVTKRFQRNGVVPHEVAHLAGVDDLYDKSTGRPRPSEGDKIMNRVPGVIEDRTVEGMLNARTNVHK
ncbi:hypothetical protein [Stenotrophomonas sp. SORGH_AS_0321]|uniref:hypothetical protein n=1 Tax=Stenotrophomonas sp. SORGH_AS_0321 TaxID=3041787 RepID=UPI00286C79A4|nr:hypothetical protein [Stenotrophomonas sp. SORGH_AS_0321]